MLGYVGCVEMFPQTKRYMGCVDMRNPPPQQVALQCKTKMTCYPNRPPNQPPKQLGLLIPSQSQNVLASPAAIAKAAEITATEKANAQAQQTVADGMYYNNLFGGIASLVTAGGSAFNNVMTGMANMNIAKRASTDNLTAQLLSIQQQQNMMAQTSQNQNTNVQGHITQRYEGLPQQQPQQQSSLEKYVPWGLALVAALAALSLKK